MSTTDEYLKCKATGECKFWTKVAYDLEVLRVEDGIFPSMFHKGMWDEVQRLKAKGEKYVLLTIRPKHSCFEDDFVLEEFTEYVDQLLSKVWLQGATWVYEQKGNDAATVGWGVHVHVVAKRTVVSGRNKTKGAMVAEVMDTYKRGFAEKFSLNAGAVDVKFIPKKDLGAVENYLLGKKTCPKKQICQEWDKKWRTDNGIENSYKN